MLTSLDPTSSSVTAGTHLKVRIDPNLTFLSLSVAFSASASARDVRTGQDRSRGQGRTGQEQRIGQDWWPAKMSILIS